MDAPVYFSVVEPRSVPIGGVSTTLCEGETQDGLHEVATSDGQLFLVIYTNEELPQTMAEILRQMRGYSLAFWLQMNVGCEEDTGAQEWRRPIGTANPLNHWPLEYRSSLQKAIETTCMTARSEYLRRLRRDR